LLGKTLPLAAGSTPRPRGGMSALIRTACGAALRPDLDDLIAGLAEEIATVMKIKYAVVEATASVARRSPNVSAGLAGLAMALGEAAVALGCADFGVLAETTLERLQVPYRREHRGFFMGQTGIDIVRACRPGGVIHEVDPGGLDGDVIAGGFGELWARACVLSRVGGVPTSISTLGNSSPGMAHGHLGRVAAAIATGLSPDIDLASLLPDVAPALPGWCNGRVGDAAAAVIGRSCGALDSATWEDFALARCWSALARVVHAQDETLCHGTAGVLCVAAGVGRCLGAPDLIDAAAGTAESAVSRLREPRLTNDQTIDNSWLTGRAGVLWALCAIRHRPAINPLIPPDSLMWSHRDA
jgi:Lanthionine synthetase C-like protein